MLAPLRAGPNGDVYRAAPADERGDGQPVVIRRMATTRSSSSVVRFFERARAASELRHPNVVTVFEVGRELDGTPFTVEAWVPGSSLAAMSARLHSLQRAWPLWLALHIAHQTLTALAYGRACDVTHGALTAHCVRLSFDGVIRVNGFGQRGCSPHACRRDLAAARDIFSQDLGLIERGDVLPAKLCAWLGGQAEADVASAMSWLSDAWAACQIEATPDEVASTLRVLDETADD
ncbi:MAG: protein kinase, partial [Myxococcota bacterium]